MLAEDDGSHPQDAGGDRQLRSGGGFSMLKKQFRITNPEGWRLARAMFDGVRCVAVATYNSTQSGCQRFKL